MAYSQPNLMHEFSVRPITSEDQDFLWEIVYHAIHVPPGAEPPPRSILNEPGVSKYVRDWGRSEDFGVVAIHNKSCARIGAAWLRTFTAADPGYGFLAPDIPELSIALLPDYRNRGVGSELLAALINHASARYRALSLAVVDSNPALRLYERLGFKRVSVNGNSITASLPFSSCVRD